VCNINKGCGFGCQLHHVAYCFVVAYGANRTLIISSRSWRYSPNGGWEKYFRPVSETCVDRGGTSRPWSGLHQPADSLDAFPADFMLFLLFSYLVDTGECLQCFDAVGWAAGRAFGL